MRKFFYKRKLDEIEEKARPIHINSYRQLVWAKFKSHKLAVLGAVMLIGVVIFTLIGPLFIDVGYEDMDFLVFSNLFSPPFTEGHLFGTDELGHDVLVRVMYGGRISLFVGFASAVITTLIGTAVGLFSGFYGGLVDRFLMRFVDVMLSIPMFPILITLTLVFGSGISNIILVLTVFGWMGVSRLVRGLVLSIRETEYVMSAKAMGVRNVRIILRHVLPKT